MGRLPAALIAFAATAGLAGCGSEAASPASDTQPSEAGAGPILSGEYLLDRDGEVVERYDAGTPPDDPELVARADELLADA